jgi:hypothetical protein
MALKKTSRNKRPPLIQCNLFCSVLAALFVQILFKYLTCGRLINLNWKGLVFTIKKIAKEEMVRYLGEPRNILAEPLGSAEPRLKNTGLGPNLWCLTYWVSITVFYIKKMIILKLEFYFPERYFVWKV